MKFHFIFFMLIIYACTLCTQQNNELPYQQPTTINITLHTANKASLHQENNVDQQAHHVATHNTNVRTDINKCETEYDYKKKLYETYQEQAKKAHELSTDATTWIKNNKCKTVAIGLLLVYSYIAYQIYQANIIINDSRSWSNWHNGTSLEDLFATPQNKLEADLLFAIQTRYVHPINPTDFIYSIVQSSTSLQKEMLILDEQIARYQRLKTSGCLPLFFIEQEELMSLQERHRKLSFIQHIFASWCANYKIDKNS